jgi:hypothetical protein
MTKQLQAKTAKKTKKAHTYSYEQWFCTCGRTYAHPFIHLFKILKQASVASPTATLSILIIIWLQLNTCAYFPLRDNLPEPDWGTAPEPSVT